MTKKIILFIMCLIIISLFISTNVNAVTVTKDNLTTSLKEYEQDSELRFLIDDTTITISNTEGSTSKLIKYNLTDKPTFTIESNIQNGLSYSDFIFEMQNISFLSLVYSAIANIQGVDYTDAGYYILIDQYMQKEMDKNGFVKDNSYTIVDDSSTDTSAYLHTISKADFPNRVMEYLNATYYDNKTISDADTLNTYKLSFEKKDVTTSSCKIITTLTVNTDGDFSSLKGFAAKSGSSSENLLNPITQNINKYNEDTNKSATNSNENTNKKANLDILPKTGKDINYSLIFLYSLIGVSITGIIILTISFIRKK